MSGEFPADDGEPGFFAEDGEPEPADDAFGYSEGYNDDGGFAVGGEDADFNDTTDAGAGAGAGAEAATDTKGDDDGPAISAVARWRLEQRARLDAKEAAAREAKGNRKEAAKAAKQAYYEDKERQHETMSKAARESEEQFLARLDAELEADDPWKRVASLIDIGNDDELHVQDVSRFREVLVQLKTNAPLAADN